MSGEYGGDFISLVGDDGTEYELEYLDTIEYGGETYMAMLPTDIDERNEDFGFIILKVVMEGEEELLVTVDDDEELDNVYDVFVKTLFDEDDEDDEDDAEDDDDVSDEDFDDI